MDHLNVTTSVMNDAEGNVTAMSNTSLSQENDLNNSRTKYIARLFISFFLSPSVMIIGVIGNILTVKLFRAKKNKTASSIFITCLAASDTLLLVLKLIYTIYLIGYMAFPHTVNRIPIRSSSWIWLADLPERIGKLLTIGIMSERVFAVFFPLRLKQVWTRRRTQKLVAVIIILVLITGLPPYIDVLYFGFVYTFNGSKYYSPLQDSVIYVKNIKEWSSTLQFINRLNFDLVSLLIIFVLCVITSTGIKGLMTAKSLSFSDLELDRRRKKERKITITMLTMSSLFFLLSGPLHLCGVLVKLKVIAVFDVPLVVTSLLHMFLHLNSMVNFIIYGLADKVLRKEYIRLLKCCKSKGNGQKTSEDQIKAVCQLVKTGNPVVNTNRSSPTSKQETEHPYSQRNGLCNDNSINRL